jgi:lysine/ornithine N-monooxygenase
VFCGTNWYFNDAPADSSRLTADGAPQYRQGMGTPSLGFHAFREWRLDNRVVGYFCCNFHAFARVEASWAFMLSGVAPVDIV